MGEPVTLYVYDLSNGLAQLYGAALTGRPVEGIWHSALVLYGIEVFFGHGISIVSPPGTTHHGSPKKKIPCGVTHLDKETFLEYIDALRATYTADAYHLLEFNCNTFTNDVLGFLNGGSIPADIRNQPTEIMATPFGQSMRPMIEQMFTGRRTQSAGAAVNTLLPQLGITPSSTPPAGARPSRDDVPSAQSVASNLEICTSAASLRSTLSSSPAVAVMFTSPTCPPCAAIKPHFEALATQHSAPASKRIVFVLVETHIGGGGEVARSPEFGGPVTATPSFAFFARGAKVGECKGADRRELDTQVGMLALAAYPVHPHAKLPLPALKRLARNLRPVTSTAFPPLPALKKKLEEALSGCDPDVVDILAHRVPAYLAALRAPPAPALSPASRLPTGLLDAWLPATLRFLQSPAPPAAQFPVVDLVRLALARDAARLAAQPAFVAFVAQLAAHLASVTDDSNAQRPDRAYVLTALRTLSNALAAPALAARVLAPDARPALTRLVLRALLAGDGAVVEVEGEGEGGGAEGDARLRAAGAGTAWSVVARVFAARVGDGVGEAAGIERAGEHAVGEGEGEGEGGEEWEAEMATAVVEALARETKSVEVVHRLAATLGLLLYQSPYFDEIAALLEALDTEATLKRKEEMVKARVASLEADEGKEAAQADYELVKAWFKYKSLVWGIVREGRAKLEQVDTKVLKKYILWWGCCTHHAVRELFQDKLNKTTRETLIAGITADRHNYIDPEWGEVTWDMFAKAASDIVDLVNLVPPKHMGTTYGDIVDFCLYASKWQGTITGRTHYKEWDELNSGVHKQMLKYLNNTLNMLDQPAPGATNHTPGQHTASDATLRIPIFALYGENLFMMSSKANSQDSTSSVLDAVGSWNNEESLYDYKNPGFTHETGHFTQTVWVGTKSVGCAMGTCMGLMSSGEWAVYYVCEVCSALTNWLCSCTHLVPPVPPKKYYPAGNWEGQFPENVLPP
ncbi:hypothetical protein JCM3770_006997 [Rhodotorula araucariae]